MRQFGSQRIWDYCESPDKCFKIWMQILRPKSYSYFLRFGFKLIVGRQTQRFFDEPRQWTVHHAHVFRRKWQRKSLDLRGWTLCRCGYWGPVLPVRFAVRKITGRSKSVWGVSAPVTNSFILSLSCLIVNKIWIDSNQNLRVWLKRFDATWWHQRANGQKCGLSG